MLENIEEPLSKNAKLIDDKNMTYIIQVAKEQEEKVLRQNKYNTDIPFLHRYHKTKLNL